MLQRIGTVAFNAYREAVRARILLGLAGVAFVVAFCCDWVVLLRCRSPPRGAEAGW